jgi:hypothetical protein
LAAPELSGSNRNYLERNPGGWSSHFRNGDDALAYQPVWLSNAFLQSRYGGAVDREFQRQSFDWLLLQSLPDGGAFGNNHPKSVSTAGSAYLGALLLGDPRYVWLADRTLTALEADGGFLPAQPGLERSTDGTGKAPSEGSCLMYGDSGLPGSPGPLAPDKIVLRDGWSPDDAFLELDLRFTGWHRYKATNTVSLLYRNGPLVEEQLDGQPADWLPSGRSLFRDKRVPRENLNGLVVSRTGLSAALSELTGAGSDWAQDPPFYARVESFSTGDIDTASITITNWHGWRHTRSVALFPGGPVLVADRARGPQGSRSAIWWHVATKEQPQIMQEHEEQQQRITLRGGLHPAELLVLPAKPSSGDGGLRVEAEPGSLSIAAEDASSGRLDSISLFLTDDWVGATAEDSGSPDEPILKIIGTGGQTLSMRLPAAP